MIAAAPDDRYFSIVEVLFRQQDLGGAHRPDHRSSSIAKWRGMGEAQRRLHQGPGGHRTRSLAPGAAERDYRVELDADADHQRQALAAG